MGERGAHGERGALDAGLIVGKAQQRPGEHETGPLLDIAVEHEALDHHLGAPDTGRGAQERLDRLERRLGDVVAQRASAGNDEGVTAHPQGGLPDRVDELGVHVERSVNVVPHACGGGQPLAASTLDASWRVDLVGRAADDDQFARQPIAQRRQRQRSPHDRAGYRAVPAGVDRLGRAVLAHRSDRVVERNDADAAAGAPTREGRSECGAEPGDALLHAKAAVM